MWMNSLNLQDYSTAFVNAWETDYIDEPLIPIMHALIERAKQSLENNEIVATLTKVMGVVVSQIAKQYTGVDPLEVIKQTNDKDFERSGKEIFDNFSKLKSSLSSTKEALRELVESCEKKPFFIFVDELDRAKPDYSVKFLERIKHFFGLQGIVFVIAVHKEQLASSMKTIYGQDLDFDGYYRRFITQEAKLPPIDEAGLLNIVKHLISKIFTKGIPIQEDEKVHLIEYLRILINIFQPSLRDLNYSFYIVRRYLNEYPNEQKMKITWIRVLFFMVFLSLSDESIYEELGKNGINSNNENSLADLFKRISLQFPQDSAWIITDFLISLKTEGNLAQVEKMFREFCNPDIQSQNIFNNSRNDSNSPRNAYRNLYVSLENWKKAF